MNGNVLTFGQKAENILANKVTVGIFPESVRASVLGLLASRNGNEQQNRAFEIRAYRYAQMGQIVSLAVLIPNMAEIWHNAQGEIPWNHFGYGLKVANFLAQVERISQISDEVVQQREIDYWLREAWDLWRALKAPYGECSRPECHNPLKAKGHKLCPYHYGQQRGSMNEDENWQQFAVVNEDTFFPPSYDDEEAPSDPEDTARRQREKAIKEANRHARQLERGKESVAMKGKGGTEGNKFGGGHSRKARHNQRQAAKRQRVAA